MIMYTFINVGDWKWLAKSGRKKKRINLINRCIWDSCAVHSPRTKKTVWCTYGDAKHYSIFFRSVGSHRRLVHIVPPSSHNNTIMISIHIWWTVRSLTLCTIYVCMHNMALVANWFLCATRSLYVNRERDTLPMNADVDKSAKTDFNVNEFTREVRNLFPIIFIVCDTKVGHTAKVSANAYGWIHPKCQEIPLRLIFNARIGICDANWFTAVCCH